MTTRNRTLFYLFLALLCYTLGTVFSVATAAIMFFIIGGIAELLFWFSLFQKQQNRNE